jgi:hypothetical protein
MHTLCQRTTTLGKLFLSINSGILTGKSRQQPAMAQGQAMEQRGFSPGSCVLSPSTGRRLRLSSPGPAQTPGHSRGHAKTLLGFPQNPLHFLPFGIIIAVNT